MEIQMRTSSAPNWNAQASFGNHKKIANIPFQANQPEIAKKDSDQSKHDDSTSAKKESRWSSRKVVDAFTVTFYAALVASAIAMSKSKSPLAKAAKSLEDAKRTTTSVRKGIEEIGKQKTGEMGQTGPMYKLFSAFQKWKANSAELTNNLVYGFGTLVVMPLVILFSPIGKKDASKEDRTFTVLRQPISFATVFAIQFTFEKVFKNLMDDINKFGLLDKKCKDKKNTELFFSENRIKEALSEDLKGHGEKGSDGVERFHFNQECLDNKEKFKDELKVLKEHLEGLDTKFKRKGEAYGIKKLGKGNEFTLDEFADNIHDLISNVGENLKKPTAQDVKNPLKSTKTLEKIEHLKEMLSHYSEKIPNFEEKLTSMAKAPGRSRLLKETVVIVANCLISQALGIMMLNFVYGKMMKKYVAWKHSISQDQQTQVKGGVNNAN